MLPNSKGRQSDEHSSFPYRPIFKVDEENIPGFQKYPIQMEVSTKCELLTHVSCQPVEQPNATACRE